MANTTRVRNTNTLEHDLRDNHPDICGVDMDPDQVLAAKALFDAGPVHFNIHQTITSSPKTPGRMRSYSEPPKVDVQLDPITLLGVHTAPSEAAQRMASRQYTTKRSEVETMNMPSFGLFGRSLHDSLDVIGSRQRASSLLFAPSDAQSYSRVDPSHSKEDDAAASLAHLSLQSFDDHPSMSFDKSSLHMQTKNTKPHSLGSSSMIPPSRNIGSIPDDRNRQVGFNSISGSNNPWPSLQQSINVGSAAKPNDPRSRGSSVSSDHGLNDATSKLLADDENIGRECSNLFVNYLPQSVDDRMLYQLFGPFGEITSYKVMLDLNTNRSRCFGFVKYRDLESAKKALQQMNGKKLEHKTLIVKYANTEDTTSMGTPSNNLYIKGLPPNFGDQQLKLLFERYGNIQDCRVLVDMVTGVSRGIAFVRFSEIPDAMRAIAELNNSQVAGSDKPILVKFADTDDERVQRKQRQVRRRKLQQIHINQQLQGVGMGMGMGMLPPYTMWDEAYYRQMPMVASPIHKAPSVMPFGYPSPIHSMPSPLTGPHSLMMPPPMSSHMDAVSALGGMDGMGISISPTPAAARSSDELIGMSPVYSVQLPPPMMDAILELCVNNIPMDADEQFLYSLFHRYGSVTYAKVMIDEHNRNPYGVVRMHFSEAMSALSVLNGYIIAGKPLQINFKSV